MMNFNTQERFHASPRLSGRWLVLVLVLLLPLLILAPEASQLPAVSLDNLSLPLSFVPNAGQSTAGVQFQAHDRDATLFFKTNEVLLNLPESTGLLASQVGITFVDANLAAAVVGEEQGAGSVNYLLGSDPEAWLTDLPTFAGIRYESLYPGIDLVYDGTQGRLKGTYYVAPGADPGLIRWQHSGVEGVAVDHTGNLQLVLPGAGSTVLVEEAPIAWQDIGGKRYPVTAGYVVAADNAVSFRLGNYDITQPLVIDPTLDYSITFGGSGFEEAEGVAVDAAGNVYVTGMTTSSDFPTVKPFDSKGGLEDIFVTKIDPSGQNLIYSTYIGGSADDMGNGIAVTGNGVAYIVGTTFSNNFPTANPIQNQYAGLMDTVVLGVKADGSGLLFSTFLGGSLSDQGEEIALDDQGALLVGGFTFSSSFPTVNPWQGTLKGPTDGFVAKIKPDRSGLAFSTFIGGSELDTVADVAADPSGIYVTGTTFSGNFPVKNAYSNSYSGSGDAFVAKLQPDGQDVLFSTYLGGSGKETAYGLAVYGNQPVVVGATESSNFPTKNAFQSARGGVSDAFVAQLAAGGNGLVFSTFLGGSDHEIAYGVAANAAGDIYLAGHTASKNFPLKDALQTQLSGGSDAMVAKFSGGSLAYSTYLGGTADDVGSAIAVQGTDAAYVAGMTDFSGNFPEEEAEPSPPFVKADAFVARILDEGGSEPPPPPPPPPSDPDLRSSTKKASANTLVSGEELTYTIRLVNNGGAGTTADVTDELPEQVDYVNGSVTGGGVYDAASRTVSWNDVSVPAEQEVSLSFKVTADVDKVATVVNTALITPEAEQSFERSAAVVLLPEALPDDKTPPEVLSVEIDEQDVLTDPSVTLYIDATDNERVAQMYIKEVWLATKPVPHWETVQSSGWVPYESEYEWDLIDESGTHYIMVWVSDEAGNISIPTKDAIDFASLLLPAAEVGPFGLVPYLVHFESGTSVTAVLESTSGDADLYVWYPDNRGLPDQKSIAGGSDTDQVNFVAPETGTYLFVVFGFQAATYDLAIEPGGGMVAVPEQAPLAESDKFVLTSDLILSQSGLDPLGVVESPAAPGGSENTYMIQVPLIVGGGG